MTDHWVVGAAALAAVVAVLAPPVPVVAAVLFLALAAVTRRPEPVAVAVALVVGARAHDALAALDRPLPSTVDGVAQLVGDPRPGRYSTRVEVSIGGRRYLAEVPRDQEGQVDDLLTGDRVVLRARPRRLRSVPEGWRRSRHLAGRLAVGQVDRGPPPAPWYAVANGIHRRLATGSTSFGEQHQALFMGLVLGDDRRQTDLDRYRFRATGLGHLLAVSGQNVAFLMALARPLMERVGLRARWVLGLGVLVVFVLVTRAEASVLRAAAMAAVALTASGLGRVAPGARVLGLAVLALLLADPLLVHSTGFRLSVAATAGLLVGVRPLARRLPGPRALAEPLATTLAAQAATAPLLVGMAGGVPAVATVANLLAVPAAGLVMMLGLSSGLAAGFVRPPLDAVLQWPTRVLVAWVDGVARVGSGIPVPWLDPARIAVLAGAGLLVVLVRRHGSRSGVVAGTVAAVVLVTAALWPVRPGPGRFVAAAGVVVEVGGCGDRVVTLGGSVGALVALDGLRSLGVWQAGLVRTGPAQRAAGREVADQLGAGLRVEERTRGPGGPVPAGGASDRPCTVSP